MSPKKVRLVIDVIRGMDALDAKKQLAFMTKKAARPVGKLLDSAIANATNNFGLKENNLYVKEVMADGGPSLKRWRPRAFGRASKILKRTSHILIVLGERVPTDPKKAPSAGSGPGGKKKEEVKVEKVAEKPKEGVEAPQPSLAKGPQGKVSGAAPQGKPRLQQHQDKKGS